jgi:uncharacterized protein
MQAPGLSDGGFFCGIFYRRSFFEMGRLILFLAIFLTVYAGMHVLVFWGARPLLPSRWRFHLLLALVMALMVFSPLLVRVLEREGLETAARGLGLISYTWMGFLFLAFVGFFIIYLWDLIVLASTCLTRSVSCLVLYGPKSSAAVLFIAFFLGLYGFFEAKNLHIEQVRIETGKLPAYVSRLRVVQLSDLHLGLINRTEFLKKVVKAVKDLHPDILVATGDIVDAQINRMDGMTELFEQVHPPLGKYAVTGNHEYYAGLAQALDFIRRCGFVVLRNETLTIDDKVRIVGVDDPAGGDKGDEVPLLHMIDREKFIILLKHRPSVSPGAEGLFDLQLSGHAHRGQISPFNLLTHLFYPMQDGLYLLSDGSRLYVSRGTGTWGPPMRVFSPPEITLIEIVRRM